MQIVLREKIDIAIVDIKLPEYNGIVFLKKLKQEKPDVEVIMMSGHGDMENVIGALRGGAFDFLQKPFTPLDIKVSIERTRKYVLAMERAEKLQNTCNTLQDEILAIGDIQFVGISNSIKNIGSLIDAASKHPESPVLITGESGTGKELVARLIHLKSQRSTGRFVSVNCAAISSQIFESEFFGHKKGSFTDAKDERKGFFRTADKGTLFLDEIGDMPYEMQTKLLRVIEEKMVKPVGSDDDFPVDVRIICATNQIVENLLNSKNFRLDLYHRISVVDIHIPPLRERPEDIPVLVFHLIEKLSKKMGKLKPELDETSMQELYSFNFPGNVRELNNIIEKAMIIGKDPLQLNFSHGYVADSRDSTNMQNKSTSDLPSFCLEELEQIAIRKVLGQVQRNLTKASAILGISRQALDRRMIKYHIKNV